MKRIKMVICITALCGLCAIGGVSSASAALPEFLPASGTFLSTSGTVTLATASGTELKCTSDKEKGLIAGSESVVDILSTLYGCVENVFGSACSTSGEPSGLITTRVLSGLFGYINKSSKSIGLDLAPASGTEFVEFNCAGGLVKLKARGSIIGQATPINTKTTSGKLTYKKSGAKQEFTKFEGGAVDLLEFSISGGAFEGSAIETSETITFHQPTEAMA
jgi:hypothetical protein